MRKVGTEGMCVSVCPLSEAVNEQGQKSTVNYPPEEKKTSTHGSASHVPAVRATRGLLQVNEYAWLL